MACDVIGRDDVFAADSFFFDATILLLVSAPVRYQTGFLILYTFRYRKGQIGSDTETCQGACPFLQ